MAGVAGFEPAHGDTKNRCLTAWLHPNSGGFYNGIAVGLQAVNKEKTRKSRLDLATMLNPV